MREIPYKSVGDRTLVMHVVPPRVPPGQPRVSPGQPAPTAVFYHGGGWLGGTWRQFLPQAERLATLGMAAVLVEYRLEGPL
ncbi:MAG TPA: hypothetical protein VIP77_14035, partial [Jiangellaceae bacterium]